MYDENTFVTELAAVFDHEPMALAVLAELRYPVDRIPRFENPRLYWRQIVREVSQGVLATGGVELIAAAARAQYPANPVFAREAEHLPAHPQGIPVWPTLTFRGADRYDDFLRLAREIVDPQAELLYAADGEAAVFVGGFREDNPDPVRMLQRLRDAARSLVADDQLIDVQFIEFNFRPHLIRTLRLVGPDQRVFIADNVPNTTRVRDIPYAVLSFYGQDIRQDRFSSRRMVVDRVAQGAEGGAPRRERLDPYRRLEDAGVRENDELHIRPTSFAGGPGPTPRRRRYLELIRKLAERGQLDGSDLNVVIDRLDGDGHVADAGPDEHVTHSPRQNLPGNPAPPPPATTRHVADDPPERRLWAELPRRAEPGRRVSLLVRVLTSRSGTGVSKAVAIGQVPPEGRKILISVSAPDLDLVGDQAAELLVPANGDSDPVHFSLTTRGTGLQRVVVRAFIEGTFLCELTAEISVEPSAPIEKGRQMTVAMGLIATQPGEVTLQVQRIGGNYQFQLLGDVFSRGEVLQLAANPSVVVDRIADELRQMAKGRPSTTSSAAATQRLRNLGAELWSTAVPLTIRELFWSQVDRIGSFTIASDLDVIPWELLYPVDGQHELDGFLVEQFPVVRRVYGQGRAPSLNLGARAYVLPASSPMDARTEIDAVEGCFGASGPQRVIETKLGLDAALEPGNLGLVHFACHNSFSTTEGSVIKFADAVFRPSDLSLLAQRRTLEDLAPLVFMNACRSAGEIESLSGLSGWASKFMSAGAGAFIGTLWGVRSSSAKLFAEQFYRHFAEAETTGLGGAALAARKATREVDGDPTWLAYAVYGNPGARRAQSIGDPSC